MSRINIETGIENDSIIKEINYRTITELIVHNCPNLKTINCPNLKILRVTECNSLVDINNCKKLEILKLHNCKNIKNIPENKYYHLDIYKCMLLKNLNILPSDMARRFSICDCPFLQLPPEIAEFRKNTNNSFANKIMYAIILHKIKKRKKKKIKNKLDKYIINDLIDITLVYI
jgi:hypothetical protein